MGGGKARVNLQKTANLKRRLIAISASLAIGLGLMVVKFFAFWLTGSAAILSDAPLCYL
jgi:divalent metal cation (Fe/Co/Zn/Cd) transporter